MSLVVGDTHGNYEKAKFFLEYRPDEEHIFVGDIVDSYTESKERILNTLKLVFSSNVIILAGNHDLQYFPNAYNDIRFKCTGRKDWIELKEFFNEYHRRMKAAYIVDDYIITHAGVSDSLYEYELDICNVADICNRDLEWFNNLIVRTESLSPIFNIGSERGGSAFYGGIFWRDSFENAESTFNQIFGHSKVEDPEIEIHNITKVKHINLDFKQFFCYNTRTSMFEDFMPEHLKSKRNELERWV